MRRLIILLSLIAFGFVWAIPAAKGAGSYDFTTFDVPFPAPFSGAVNTEPDGINNLSQVVGGYANGTRTIIHGFQRNPDGSFTRIDAPSSLSQDSTFDFPPDLNDANVIVGRYRIFSPGTTFGDHCYVSIAGVFLTVDVPFPHAPIPGGCRGINNVPSNVSPSGQSVGEIVGVYRDPTFFRIHGFLIRNNTFFNPIDVDFPDANAVNTFSRRINDFGQIVGFYFNPLDRRSHGFLLSGFGGTFSKIDFPDAVETIAEAINNKGQIVGDYVDTDSHVHGFLCAIPCATNGSFTTVALPGVIQNADGSTLFDLNFTVGISGINDAGVITGAFLGADGNFHGFVGVPQNSQ